MSVLVLLDHHWRCHWLTLLFFSHYFFFNATAYTEIYTLSLHDALPILGDEFFPFFRQGIANRSFIVPLCKSSFRITWIIIFFLALFIFSFFLFLLFAVKIYSLNLIFKNCWSKTEISGRLSYGKMRFDCADDQFRMIRDSIPRVDVICVMRSEERRVGKGWIYSWSV